MKINLINQTKANLVYRFAKEIERITNLNTCLDYVIFDDKNKRKVRMDIVCYDENKKIKYVFEANRIKRAKTLNCILIDKKILNAINSPRLKRCYDIIENENILLFKLFLNQNEIDKAINEFVERISKNKEDKE